MKADRVEASAIVDAGMIYLKEKLGVLETELFISEIRNDRFDYTEWRRDNLYKGMDVYEINRAAVEYERVHGIPEIRGANPPQI
jgi:hypothetical protein